MNGHGRDVGGRRVDVSEGYTRATISRWKQKHTRIQRLPDTNGAKLINNINASILNDISFRRRNEYRGKAITNKVHNNAALFNRVSTAVQLRIRLPGSLCLSYSLPRSTPPVREVVAAGKVRTHARTMYAHAYTRTLRRCARHALIAGP